MATYSVVAADGQMYGPADENTLIQWASEGRVTATTILHCHENNARMVASAVPALQTILGGVAAPAPAPAYVAPQGYVQPQAYAQPQQQYGQPQAYGAPGQIPQQPYGQPGMLSYAGYAVGANVHTLTSFSTGLVVLLHFLTGGLFTWIHFGLMHDQMPKLRADDPSAGKAIGFMFIPIFSLYWVFFTNLRLIERINEQRRFANLPETSLKPMFLTAQIGMFVALTCLCVPFVGILLFLVPVLVLFPIYVGMLRASVNELVAHTRPGC